MPKFDLSRLFIGQRQTSALLERALDADRVSHAYILAGPPKVGKTTLAIALAAALNCEAETRPCGVCRSCRLIAAGHHPDVRHIRGGEPPASDAGRRATSERGAVHLIGIEAVRAIQHDASLAPVEGSRKVYIIEDASMLSLDAAGALLKTLEEPPPHSILVLTTTDTDSLLATVISRCQVLRVPAVGTAELASELASRQAASPARAQLVAGLSGGRPGWAIEALREASILDERTRRLDELEALTRGGRIGQLAFSEKLAADYTRDRPGVVRVLNLWLGYWRDVRLHSVGCVELIANTDRAPAIASLAASSKLARIDRVCTAISDTLVSLSQNVNPRLALDVLILSLPTYERTTA